MTKPERPVGVTVLSFVFVLLGIIDAIRCVFPRGFARGPMLELRLGGVGITLLVFVVLDVVAAYGLWTARRWAWIMALGFAAIRIVIAVVSLFARPTAGSIIPLILCLLVIYYLIHPRVQSFYGRRSPSTTRLVP